MHRFNINIEVGLTFYISQKKAQRIKGIQNFNEGFSDVRSMTSANPSSASNISSIM